MILSALTTALIRWATMIHVWRSWASASWIRRSVATSTALVLSSRMRIGACFTSARAIARRCFCPPDRFTPRWPTIESYPSGRSRMNGSACAAIAARSISSSVASGRPNRMLSRIVPLKSTASCNARATLFRSSVSSMSRTSVPSIRTRPDVTS